MSNCFYDCIDCGSEFCPCELAETGDCLVCSRLAGKSVCDCDWKGVCIYNEFVQEGEKAKARRTEFEAEIVEKKEYGSDTFVLVLNVGRGFALKCSRPGSYVFLKNPEDEAFYNLPISVLHTDVERGTIHLAVKTVGSKSKRIAQCEKVVTVRGVYKNGIIGVRNLIGIRGSVDKSQKLMIVTKGIGFAPAVLLLDWISGKARADLYIDKDKIEESLIAEYMPKDLNGTVCYIDLQTEFAHKGKRIGANLLDNYRASNYDKVVVLTSDYYINEIAKIIKTDARSNNFHICCGEGLCGACGFTDKTGRCFKMCKCAEEFANLL